MLVSTLPTILLNELGGGAPDWLFWAKVGFVAVMLLFTLISKTIKPLAPYFIVILVLFLAE